MTEYFALLKTKGQKTWRAAFPIKKGVTKLKARSIIQKNIKKGKTYRIVSKKELQNYMKRQK